MGWQSMVSPVGPRTLLRVYSSLFFQPIAASVVSHSLEFPDFPFVKTA
jgi:hypothetical protein